MNKAPFSTPPQEGHEGSQQAVARAAIRSLKLAASAILEASESLEHALVEAVDVLSSTHKVVVTGVGKSAHIGAKIAATLNSTGTRALFLHAGEALHGDLGAVEHGDAILCLSKSGRSDEILALLPALERRECAVVAMTADADSPLGRAARVVVNVGVREEACPFDLAPTTSTSLQLALGDALAMALMKRSGFNPDDFARNHPAGALGKRLTWTLKQLVDPQRQPAVPWDAPLADVLQAMSDGRYGATVVWAASGAPALGGIVTDGDLRRALAGGAALDASAHALASPRPFTLEAHTLAHVAAKTMQDRGISQVVVTDNGRYCGMVHVHDCMREGLV